MYESEYAIANMQGSNEYNEYTNNLRKKLANIEMNLIIEMNNNYRNTKVEYRVSSNGVPWEIISNDINESAIIKQTTFDDNT